MRNANLRLSLLEHYRFIGWDHVFDVDESVWTSSFLQDFQSLLNQVADVLVKSLVVVDRVSHIH